MELSYFYNATRLMSDHMYDLATHRNVYEMWKTCE